MNRAQVAVEISALRESFLAMITNERFFLVVETLMSHQVRVTYVAVDQQSLREFRCFDATSGTAFVADRR